MGLVIVLRFFVGEHEVKGNLVSLIDHGPVAGGHFAGVKMQNTRNRAQEFLHAGQQFIGGVWVGRIGPEYDDV
jgi:hypothetical protein